jgi:phage regulator Rha-like protein
MTKRDEAVFDKAFKKMEAKGYFTELREKTKAKPQAKSNTKPMALKTAKKLRQRTAADSVSSARSALNVPLAAQKR